MPAVLVFSSLLIAPFTLFAIETIAYFSCWRWYYILGPALHREQWQTVASADEAANAIDEALPAIKWIVKRRGGNWLMRFRWWELSAWPRIRVHVKDDPHGAVIAFEVRPFLSMAAFLPVFLLLTIVGFVPLLSAMFVAYIVIAYAVMWWWELRRLRRLQPLRDRLTHIGLEVCTACGYDLHALPKDAPCPECGAARVVETAIV